MKRWLVILAAMVALAALVGQAQTNAPALRGPALVPQTDAGNLKGFMVPEYGPDGQLTWRMFGETARVELVGGKVEVHVMKLELYQNGAVDATIYSPVCLFDRTAKTAASEDAVKIVATNMVVTGTGFDWSSTDNRMRIRTDATMTILNRKGMAFPTTGAK